MRMPGSEQGRRGVRWATLAIREHAATVLGERSSSKQRGRAMGIFKSTQDVKAPGAVKEHTNEVRGGGRDPGLKKRGAGLGLSPARSKIFRASIASSGFPASPLISNREF